MIKKMMFCLSGSAVLFSVQSVFAEALDTPASPALSYEWHSGDTVKGQSGIYGTLHVPSVNNIPGSRTSSTASAGGTTGYNIWMFGGNAFDSVGEFGVMNDLWKFDPSSGSWTWKSGSKKVNPKSNGVYGVRGTPAAANVPGARTNMLSWTDSNGNFWLFGGAGYDYTTAHNGHLNDLWKYDSTLDQWTWMKGSNVIAQKGTYGSIGVSNPLNTPGARYGSFVAIDSFDNLWLFGGYGYDSLGVQGYLNDLWRYNPVSNSWTWMAGSKTIGADAVFGTMGVPDIANTPAAKNFGKMWVDSNGKIWIFGGFEKTSSNIIGNTNDLWSFNPGTSMWTWVSGSTGTNQPGEYGSIGEPSASNIPGSRSSFAAWKDADDNLWIQGGSGVASTSSSGLLNDLWQYNMTSGLWTWQGGASTANQSGIWGSQGVSSPANQISARNGAVAFSDANGNFWLFGGNGKDSNNATGFLNDLWQITY